MDKQRVIVYIDGFNFYYGLKKDARWKKYYWLDIVRLFEMFMRPNQELVAVKYFSARVDDLDKSLRQSAFFQANKENPKFKLILGKYRFLQSNLQSKQGVKLLCISRPISIPATSPLLHQVNLYS